MRSTTSHLAAAFLLIAPLTLKAQLSATNSPDGKPLSERIVAYTIEARLDTEKKSLDGSESLTYRNLTGQPLTTFPFHLYLNAFRPESTFTAETRATGGVRDSLLDSYPAEKIGGITLSHIEADGYGDLTSTLRYTAPDDGNLQDHTVAEITLPRPLAPNATVTFHFVFHDKFPLSVARNGYKRDFIMGGQWFPKVGVFWHGAWNCHQYHSTTEFFSDFGIYNVRLTLPRNYTIGASGVSSGSQSNTDGTKTLSFYGEDIHDFAFAASPNFVSTDAIYLSSLGPVQIHVLTLTAHPHIAQRYLAMTRSSLEQYERRYGPYPYKAITVIDPEPGGEFQGMEYPTLFTADATWAGAFNLAEVTVEHEFGHQYWYGMVATNEFEEAWLDEGINSFTETKVMAAILGDRTSGLNRNYANLGDDSYQRISYLLSPDLDPVTRFAWKFRNGLSYDAVSYGKTATLLATLEGIIGRDTMDAALRTYFERYRFTHPTGEDFLRTIEQVAVAQGKATASPVANSPQSTEPNTTPDFATAPVVNSSLRPFINQAIYGTQMLDYSVDAFRSDRVEQSKGNLYNSTVYLRRRGDFILPVTAEIVFDDGQRLREHWNGNDRWTSYTYSRNAKILSVELDPDHLVPLDKNLFDNSFTMTRDAIPARKLTAIWAVLQQFAAQIVAWIV